MISIQKLGTYERQGVLTFHELLNNGAPTDIYARLTNDGQDIIGVNPLGKVGYVSSEDFAAALPEAKVTIAGSFSVVKYRLLATELTDITCVTAKYGYLRAGGIQFMLTDTVAAQDDRYTYQIEFYALDLPTVFKVYEANLFMYNLTQQLSFECAKYINGKRSAMEVIRNTNLYPKLLVGTKLTNNDLLITCTDTNGMGACEHISRSLGIAQEGIICSCDVRVVGLTDDGKLRQDYEIIASNKDYDDTPLHVVLPSLERDVTACRIDIEYLMNLQTIGETLRLTDTLVLTDDQVALLHPMDANELAGGIVTGFYILDQDNAPIVGAKVIVEGTDITAVSNQYGIAQIRTQPGSYIVRIEYDDIYNVLPITVSQASVVRVTMGTRMVDMKVEIIGTDDRKLANLQIDVDGATYTTNANGELVLRGATGHIFTLSRRLGVTLHQFMVEQGGQTMKLRLYNKFDDEFVLDSQLT